MPTGHYETLLASEPSLATNLEKRLRFDTVDAINGLPEVTEFVSEVLFERASNRQRGSAEILLQTHQLLKGIKETWNR